MNKLMMGAASAATCILLAAGSASAAQGDTAAQPSPATITRLFLQNATQNLDFLDRSSRLALTNTKGARIHAFAFAEAREQTLAANAIDDVIEAKAPVQTGRSASVGAAQDAALDPRLPLGQEDLNSLEGLDGSDFDEQYKAKQLEALKQVREDYQHYIAEGDDPALITIAKRELPAVQKRIDEVGKL